MHETHGVSVVQNCQAVVLARSACYCYLIDWQIREAEVIEALNQSVETPSAPGKY